MPDLGKAEWWGVAITTVATGVAGFWRWLVTRKREGEAAEETLDDSRIGALSNSWRLQKELTAFWEERFSQLAQENNQQRRDQAAMREQLEKLQVEHAECERTTTRLARQNAEQAEQIRVLGEELAELRNQTTNVRLRAV